jgi:nucleoid-associated protein YgaU
MAAQRTSGSSRARGLGAAAVLVLLTVGFPIALWAVGGSPIPGSVPTWAEIAELLGSPVQQGLLLGVLKYLAWAGWLVFTLSVVGEVAARLRGVRAPRLGPQQALAAALVAAAAIGLSTPAAAAAAPAQVPVEQAPVPGTEPAPGQAAPVRAPVPIAPVGTEAPPPGFHARVIGDGEILWDIAEEELGDGLRYTEIFAASTGIVQPDGSRIERPHLVRAGWTVWIPDRGPDAAGTHVVAHGESLWDIAAQHLGDPDRYMELYRANAGAVQADGGALTDPRVIEPGWVLRVPGPSGTTIPEEDHGEPDSPAAPAAGLRTLTPLHPLPEPLPSSEPSAGASAHPAPAATPAPLATTTPMTPPAEAPPPLPLDTSQGSDMPATPALQVTTPLNPAAAAFAAEASGLTVRLSAPSAPGASHAWFLGDGSAASGPQFDHTYAAAGTYLVTMTSTAKDGAVTTTSRPVSVG